MIKGHGSKYIAYLHERYGDVVRVGPNELSYISASANRTMFGGKPTEETVYEKNPAVWLQGSGKILNIFFAHFRDHGRYRKLMAPAFAEAAIREQEPAIQKLVDQFMDGMRNRSGEEEFPDAKGVVNMAAWHNFVVFDILTRLSFGSALKCLEQGKFHPWLRVIYGAIKHSHYVQAAHRLKPYHKILEYCIPASVTNFYTTHLDFSHKQLLDRQDEDKDEKAQGKIARTDFASFILKGLTQEELEDNVNILVTAGGDTTATTMSSLTYYITHNPEAYRKLTEEIRGAFKEEKDITVNSASSLPYLKAVIKETLRIHPSIPVGLHRLAPKKGAVIDGQFVPGGVCGAPIPCFRCVSN
jgi:cytochrome P450